MAVKPLPLRLIFVSPTNRGGEKAGAGRQADANPRTLEMGSEGGAKQYNPDYPDRARRSLSVVYAGPAAATPRSTNHYQNLVNHHNTLHDGIVSLNKAPALPTALTLATSAAKFFSEAAAIFTQSRGAVVEKFSDIIKTWCSDNLALAMSLIHKFKSGGCVDPSLALVLDICKQRLQVLKREGPEELRIFFGNLSDLYLEDPCQELMDLSQRIDAFQLEYLVNVDPQYCDNSEAFFIQYTAAVNHLVRLYEQNPTPQFKARCAFFAQRLLGHYGAEISMHIAKFKDYGRLPPTIAENLVLLTEIFAGASRELWNCDIGELNLFSSFLDEVLLSPAGMWGSGGNIIEV